MSKIVSDFGLDEALNQLGLKEINEGTSTGSTNFGSGELIASYSPVDGSLIGKVKSTTKADYEKVIATAEKAFLSWRNVPAPQRGEIVRQFGNKLRDLKEPLGKLVSYEMGKSLQEGYGEVQEMIDICDFAVGLSRQLNGQTIPSERPGHVMREQWHPIGIVGIISAFNFPVAVWAWNTALAWICGDVCVWKASEKAPLCSVACQNIIAEILKENKLPEGISCIINGDYKVGEMMTTDSRIPLVSATGSTRMGRIVGATVAERFGKSLLELGSVYDKVRDAIVGAYEQLTIGNPLDEKNHIGPLIDKDAVNMYLSAIEKAKTEGGNVLVDGGILEGKGYESGCYVKPAIIEAENHFEIVQHETFAPILYLMKYSGEVENAIAKQNGVAQGLSSAIMTNEMKEAEKFLSYAGSDCGIANVNIGTSGAEIGGAFGGEKETGGGRESGSDAWKVYMRRQTNTINYSDELPLAQGIKFDL